MDASNKPVVKWYIIFRKAKIKHWVFKWIHPEFQHCYAVKDCDTYWIVVDGATAGTDVFTLDKIDYPHVRLIEPNGVILPVKAIIDPSKSRWGLCIFSCVDICKSVLGVKAIGICTPYQLYKRLTHG